MGGWGQAFFYVCAVFALFGATATVAAKNPIRGAMGLMVMIISIAALFLSLHAQFLAAIQLIVYAGAVVVLFLFVIMLLGPSAIGPSDARGLGPRVFAGVLFGAAALAAIGLLVRQGTMPPPPPVGEGFGGIDEIGKSLFTKGIVPFELASGLLMVSVVGAIAIAKGKPGQSTQKVLPSSEES